MPKQAVDLDQGQVVKAQRAEALGLLAGGIAHDFNNLLTSILGFASLARMRTALDSPVSEWLGEIEAAARRAADLTQQLLAYSGKGHFVPETLDLSKLSEETAELLQSVLPGKVLLSYDLAREPVLVEADPAQIRQIVTNLLTNALEAIGGEEGAVGLKTSVLHLTAEELESPWIEERPPEGDYALLEVRDTGAGMDAATLPRIFDPYFSTKFIGRGLGLAAVLGIVRALRGSIRASSRPGQGSTFRVFLPVSTKAIARRRPSGIFRLKGTGTILVADEEESVRAVTRKALELAGYSVVEAADGAQAAATVCERGGSLAAVILDQAMAGAGQGDALQAIRSAAPELPIVLMTGGTSEIVEVKPEEARWTALLPKPFTPSRLADTLAGILASKGG